MAKDTYELIKNVKIRELVEVLEDQLTMKFDADVDKDGGHKVNTLRQHLSCVSQIFTRKSPDLTVVELGSVEAQTGLNFVDYVGEAMHVYSCTLEPILTSQG